MKLLIAFLITAIATQSFAYDLTGKLGLGASVGYPIPSFGNNFNTVANPKWGASVHARYHFTTSVAADLNVGREDFKNTTLKFDSVNLLALWRVSGASDFTPVLGAGVGTTRIKDYTPKNLKLALLARAGIEYGISSAISFGALVDYQYVSKLLGDMPTGRTHVLAPQLALTWYFGADEAKKMATEATQVLSEKKEVQNLKKEVLDATHMDSDHDGVMDSEDKCPNTKADTKVNDYGCAVDENAEVKINVEFASGKSTIAPTYAAHLKEVAAFFQKYPDTTTEIQGYTDNSGSAAQNTKLSQKRSEAVRNYLIKLGIDAKRITAKGFGPANPIADNNTAEGKQKNRRVIALISTKK